MRSRFPMRNSRTLLLAGSLVVAAHAEPQTLPAPMLYVSNEGSKSISVIDPRTNSVVRTIPVGTRPRGISVSPDGRRVYVALSDEVSHRETGGDRIAVIDAATGKLVARYPSGSDPE